MDAPNSLSILIFFNISASARAAFARKDALSQDRRNDPFLKHVSLAGLLADA
jgi:hypothetical protein